VCIRGLPPTSRQRGLQFGRIGLPHSFERLPSASAFCCPPTSRQRGLQLFDGVTRVQSLEVALLPQGKEDSQLPRLSARKESANELPSYLRAKRTPTLKRRRCWCCPPNLKAKRTLRRTRAEARQARRCPPPIVQGSQVALLPQGKEDSNQAHTPGKHGPYHVALLPQGKEDSNPRVCCGLGVKPRGCPSTSNTQHCRRRSGLSIGCPSTSRQRGLQLSCTNVLPST
jgi:hypothetical protein